MKNTDTINTKRAAIIMICKDANGCIYLHICHYKTLLKNIRAECHLKERGLMKTKQFLRVTKSEINFFFMMLLTRQLSFIYPVLSR
jgi:hypothetical protein